MIHTAELVRVLPAPPAIVSTRPGRFGPSDAYPTAVWLPILGPGAFVTWQHLARRLAAHPAGLSVSLARLATDLGFGPPRGRRSALVRTLGRLERFGVARWAGPVLIVRAELPLASQRQVARLDPAVRLRHHQLARTTPLAV